MFSFSNSSKTNNDSVIQTVLIVVVVALVLYYFITCVCDRKNRNNNNNNNSNSNSNNNMNNINSVNVSPVSNLVDGQEPDEGFDDYESYQNNNNYNETQEDFVDASVGDGQNEQPAPVESDNQNSELPAECYPKDVLNSSDLLPNDANSVWAQTNPNGQGSLTDKNFLNAGFHVGVNTVGQTLRNGNRQLRSDPPNPQVKVSPWMQTTIEPDVNRKPMEIGA
jgi:hypothetical protein